MMQVERRLMFSNSKSNSESQTFLSCRVAPVVFIVDDDHLLGEAMKRFFQSCQCSVALFRDAQDFLDHLPRDPHGCILLDMNMGDWNGFDVMQELARRGCQLPIIFVTGNTEVATIVEAMKRGAFDFFSKPADDAALYKTAIRAIEYDQKARERRMHRQMLLERAALLTPREMHVARLVAAGLLNKQIAYELGIVEKTVKAHRGRVVAKLGVGSVPELVRLIDTIGDADDAMPTENA